MDNKGKILVVDDNEDVLLSLGMLLKKHVEAVRVIREPERIDEMMQAFEPDVIILDMNFTRDAVSGDEGYHWLGHILERDPQAVVLFITAFVDTEKAVRAIKAGAVDFIPKPWDKAKLLDVVDSAVQLRASRREALSQGAVIDMSSCSSVPTQPNRTAMIGESQAIQHLRSQIEAIAPTDANVLITGENGTGKDVVAHLIHELSQRSDKPMATIDMGSIPESLFESELFGYEKGAFTDARTAKEGRVEAANGGTLFLDEIGNLTPKMQQKLLTMIEKREFSRVGGTRTREVDVRLVCATNADLQQCVARGTFRQDLLYRINTIVLHLPPLRQRGNDVMLLADYFARKLAERYRKPVPVFTDEVRRKLLLHSWPGNVRELQHVIERMVVMNELTLLQPAAASATAEAKSTETLNLAELERQAIMKAIGVSNGNLTQAAEMLGITRYALYRKIERMEK